MCVQKLMAMSALMTGALFWGASLPARAADSDGDGVDNAIDQCNNTPAGVAVDAEGRPLGDIDLDCDNDLDDFALSQQGFTGPLVAILDCNENGISDAIDIASGTSSDFGGFDGMVPDGIPDECHPDCQSNGLPDFVDLFYGLSVDLNANGIPDECENLNVIIETVPVGNLGNSGEWSGEGSGGYGPDRICGAVDYAYNIGKYEVTARQYVKFLNAVAATDTYGLYNASMNASSNGCQITQTGSAGSYTYDFSGRPSGSEADWANRPVNFVSWGDAARFANWMHNGQPTGPQDLTTTEDGAYDLHGAITNAELLAITRKAGARWVIPSEDEWYKAAYHYNNGATADYWDYPTRSDAAPTAEAPPGSNATTNGAANYFDGGFAIGTPYWRTEAGAYVAKPSDSPYGTYDQAGNVWEWNEAIIGDSYRGARGGSYSHSDFHLRSDNRNSNYPTHENHPIGFRVAEIP